MAMAQQGYDFHSAFNDTYSIVARKILRLLSENSRISITKLAEKAGISRVTAKKKLSGLEKELQIAYVPEINEEALGLNSMHLIFVKFSKEPDYDKIKSLLLASYIPQLAVAVKGTFDLFIYANALSSTEYAHWDKSMQILLSDYGALWRTSEVVHRQLGFFPLRNEILDLVKIKPKYKALLKVLNENARATFQEISRKTGMHFNTVAYNLSSLEKQGIIKSYTISIQKPIASLMAFFSKYSPSPNYEAHSASARKAFTSDDEYPVISRYLITAPLVGSFDFFTLGAFDNEKIAYARDVLYHKQLFKQDKIQIYYGTVDRVLLGKLPVRSVDTKATYKLIRWTTELK